MTQPGSFGSIVPSTDLDALARRLRDMEREIAMLKAAALGRNGYTVNNSDGDILMRIGSAAGTDRDALQLFYPNGNLALYSGEFANGTVQTYLYRDDGTVAFRVGGNPGQPQFAAVMDRTGNTVVSDDTVSGVGLGVPYIPWGPFVSASAPTDVTTSSTFVTLQSALSAKMNPRITMQILGRASDGTTAGEIRVVDEDGTQIGGTITVAAGAFQYYNVPPTALPGTFKKNKSLNIQARVTAGAGTIGVRGVYALGQQS